ncbi:universal stress protein [Desulfurispora thermophila]|uniref:universal stress protein n=1 Tax=Desulfurispora thermophila TaxID=265470 RepID=UPI00037A051E|nr:universal stress protein [Desulfurispora thermophila]
MYKKILVPIDGSDKSLKAARHAARIAEKMDGTVTLFHVLPQPPSYYMRSVDNIHQIILNEAQKYAAEVMQTTKEQLADYHLTIECQTAIGHAADEICRKAREENYDLIVIGSRGLGELAGYIMGSVSNRVVRHAPCPVLVVR